MTAADTIPARMPTDRETRPRRWRRRLLWLGAALLPLPVAVFLLDARFAAPRYRGPVSDHFDGAVFSNQAPIAEHGFLGLLKWRLGREAESWEGYEPRIATSDPPERVPGDGLRVTFVGHATVLVQTAGLNLLTDPVWSDRASPVSWAGPKRHVAPGLDFEALPPIDAVVVSHNHYDHLDLATLRRLAEEHRPAIYLPLGNAALLDDHGIEGARDLDWWESAELAEGVTLTCAPAQHFSGRAMRDRNKSLWAGFVLSTPAGPVYFAGDTGAGPQFAQVRERFGPPRLALLPIGAYLPRWFMQPVHVNPLEAAKAHLELEARTSVAVHFGCFELADDGPTRPVRDLEAACEELGIAPDRFWVLAVGEGRDVPR